VFCVVLVPAIMGVLQFGWYFYTSQMVGSAARETARRLAVGDCWTAGEALTFAAKQANLKAKTEPKGALDLTVGTPGATPGAVAATRPGPGETLRVRVDLAKDAQLFEYFPMPGGGHIAVTVDTRVEDATEDTPCT